MSATRTVKLSRPLETHKGAVTQLELREPKLRCFREYGEPFKVTATKDGQSIEHDNRVLVKFLAHMSSVDEIILDDLPATDYYAARAALVEMLLGVAGENPTAT